MFPMLQLLLIISILFNLSRSLNKTRIMAMKRNKKSLKNLKRYWRLILKIEDLDCSQWKKFTGVNNLMTEVDLVDFLVDSDKELKTLITFIKITIFLKHKILRSLKEY